MLQVPGAPWWLNWVVIYPSIAVAAVTAALMVGLIIYGATVTPRRGAEDDDCSEQPY